MLFEGQRGYIVSISGKKWSNPENPLKNIVARWKFLGGFFFPFRQEKYYIFVDPAVELKKKKV